MNAGTRACLMLTLAAVLTLAMGGCAVHAWPHQTSYYYGPPAAPRPYVDNGTAPPPAAVVYGPAPPVVVAPAPFVYLSPIRFDLRWAWWPWRWHGPYYRGWRGYGGWRWR